MTSSAPTRIAFLTETGSRYELDFTAMTWTRSSSTLGSGRLRSESGPMVTAGTVVVGEPAVILGPPLVPGTTRLIQTSRVVAIEPAP